MQPQPQAQQRQSSRRYSEGTRQDHISVIMNPKADTGYRAPSYTGMSTANTHKKCDSSGLMGAITTSVTPQSPSERKANRRAKSSVDTRSRYNSEALEATIKHVQEPVSGTPRGFQNIKKSLLEGMHGKRLRLLSVLSQLQRSRKMPMTFALSYQTSQTSSLTIDNWTLLFAAHSIQTPRRSLLNGFFAI